MTLVLSYIFFYATVVCTGIYSVINDWKESEVVLLDNKCIPVHVWLAGGQKKKEVNLLLFRTVRKGGYGSVSVILLIGH